MSLPTLYLIRHGETEWALLGKHTGRTDIALTAKGEWEARQLKDRLRGGPVFSHVFCSPLQRARRTAALAGFDAEVKIEPDLMEWHYGDYEGLKTPEIRQRRPDWNLFRDGCPGGESVTEIAGRVDKLLERLRNLEGPTLLVAHGHVLRVLAVRYLRQSVALARHLYLGTAAVSVVADDHGEPAIRLWDDRRHVEE